MKRRILSILIVLGLVASFMVALPAGANGAPPDPADIEAAIVNGLAWLADQQAANGSWSYYGYYAVGVTGMAVTKLEDRAYETGFSPFDEAYPYHQNVIDGLNYIFSQALPFAPVTPGIYFSPQDEETYQTGIAAMAIAASRQPDRVVDVLGSPVDGWTYKEVEQAIVNYFVASQNPDGGWRYYFSNQPSDNSVTGYAALGLAYATAPLYGFNCIIPPAVKTGLNAFATAIQGPDGGSQYTVGGGWENVYKTGSLLQELSFVGDSSGSPRALAAIGYIQNHWNDANEDPGWRPHHYQSMFGMMKGFQSMGIETITVGGTVDWFAEFAGAIIGSQNGDGSWPGNQWGDAILSTEWALMVLEKVAPPQECPTCDGQTVTVNGNVTVDFNKANPADYYQGDPALKDYFTYTKSGTADNWTAIFDVGPKKLVVNDGATITVSQVGAGNNKMAPGIKILSTCELEVEGDLNQNGDGGGKILVNALNLPAGDILIQVDGDVTIGGTVRNQMSGTAPTGAVPGSITIATKCGTISENSTGRIETIGVGPGGSDINLLACNGGDIVINGLVRALFKYHGAMTHLPVIKVVSFEGAVTINGNNVFGEEVLAGTKYTVTSGVIVQDYFDATAGTVNIQAKKDITVYGNALLSKYENFGAVAVKGGSNGAFGGVIDVRSLEGKIIASDRAFDNANRYNTNAKVNLLANGNIDLSVTASKNYGAADNTKAVVSTHAGIGGKGGENTLRSYSGSISIGSKAQVLADGTTAGTNLLTSCTGVTNDGIVNPAAVISINCVPPAPTGLFTDCGDFGIFCEECGQ